MEVITKRLPELPPRVDQTHGLRPEPTLCHVVEGEGGSIWPLWPGFHRWPRWLGCNSAGSESPRYLESLGGRKPAGYSSYCSYHISGNLRLTVGGGRATRATDRAPSVPAAMGPVRAASAALVEAPWRCARAALSSSGCAWRASAGGRTLLATQGDYRPRNSSSYAAIVAARSCGLWPRTRFSGGRAVIAPDANVGNFALGIGVAAVACLDVTLRRAAGGAVVTTKSTWGPEHSPGSPTRRGAGAPGGLPSLGRHDSVLGCFFFSLSPRSAPMPGL